MASIGENIREASIAAGYETQGAFAEALGLPQPRVSDLENNRYGPPELPTLIKVAKLVRRSLDRIIHGFDPAYDEIVAIAKGATDPTDLSASRPPVGLVPLDQILPGYPGARVVNADGRPADVARPEETIDGVLIALTALRERLATGHPAMDGARGPGRAARHLRRRAGYRRAPSKKAQAKRRR